MSAKISKEEGKIIKMDTWITKVSTYGGNFPRIYFTGLWLINKGFKPGSSINVDYSRESLVISLDELSLELKNTKHTRLATVGSCMSKSKRVSTIGLCGKWLEEIGFKVKDNITVEAKYGFIYIKKLNESNVQK